MGELPSLATMLIAMVAHNPEDNLFNLNFIVAVLLSSNNDLAEDKLALAFNSASVAVLDYGVNGTLAPICEVHWACPAGFACTPGSASKVTYSSGTLVCPNSLLVGSILGTHPLPFPQHVRSRTTSSSPRCCKV